MKQHLRKGVLATGLLVLGLLLSALLAQHQAGLNRTRVQQALADQGVAVESKLRQRIASYEYGLRGARGVVVVSDAALTRSLFRRYAESRDVDQEFPGARGFGFIRRVPAEGITAFLAQAQADGAPDFAMRQLAPTEGERFVIQYIEPVARNRAAVGLDVRSETNRRQAAETAMRTGKATLTGPITLVQKTTAPQRSLLFMLPVYRPGLPTTTEAERVAACVGWTYAPLSLAEVLTDFTLTAQGLDLTLKDLTQSAAGEVFFDALSSKDTVSEFAVSRSIEHFGRRWQLDIHAQAAFIRELQLVAPSTILALGAVASALLAGLLALTLLGLERKKAQAALQRDATERQFELARVGRSSAALAEAQRLGHIGSWSWQVQGDVMTWSDELFRIYGCEPQRGPLSHTDQARLFRPDSFALWRNKVANALATGAPFVLELACVRPDGSTAWLESRGECARDAAGRITGLQGTVQDITARYLVDQRLAAQSAELQRSNEELERFAYVASHDLQEPLRMVASYGQLLTRRHLADLKPEAREFVAYMVDGGQRAQALIRDLLSLARLDSRAQPMATVSLEDTLAEVLRPLRLRIQQAGAQISHDPLPTVLGDAAQLGQLLANLLGNALKFCGSAAPQVHVAAVREGSRWRISVRDNGIGIEPRYFERIFQMFQRLHLRTEFEGTGIGLAICKKVVERHGGQIGVESVPGQGSTFFFTLPDDKLAPVGQIHHHALTTALLPDRAV